MPRKPRKPLTSNAAGSGSGTTLGTAFVPPVSFDIEFHACVMMVFAPTCPRKLQGAHGHQRTARTATQVQSRVHRLHELCASALRREPEGRLAVSRHARQGPESDPGTKFPQT